MGAQKGMEMKSVKRFLAGWVLALGALVPGVASAAITYYHNDIAGSPVVATNESGQVVWRESYRPYGERTVNAPAALPNKVWFTSRRQDAETGLVYMGARYYDPVVGRFVSKDPAGFDEANLHTFNRYAYANNNPHRYVDPDGRSSVAAVLAGAGVLGVGIGVYSKLPSEQQALVLKRLGQLVQYTALGQIGSLLSGLTMNESGESNGAGATPEAENTNPYEGPVDQPVVVVDSKGNAIPVGKGEKVTSSPNGDYQQVRDREGRATGVRLDRGGHKNSPDPLAQGPHGHVLGVTTPEGNPHLPIR